VTTGRGVAAVVATVLLASAAAALALARSSASEPAAVNVGAAKELYNFPPIPGEMDASVDDPTGASDEQSEQQISFPAADPSLGTCTDGWKLSFQVHVKFTGTQGTATVLTSASGALSLTIEASLPSDAPVAKLQIYTYNYGSLRIESKSFDRNKHYVVHVDKDGDSLCIAVCPVTSVCDLEREQVCTFPSASLPETSFQIMELGKIQWGAKQDALATFGGFTQTAGFIPVSFMLRHLDYDRLAEDETAWTGVVDAMSKVVAEAAQNRVQPNSVTLFPAKAVNEEKGTYFQGTIIPPMDVEPCKIVQAFETELADKSVADSSIAAAASQAIESLDVGLSGSSLAEFAVPGESMACADFKCHDAFARKLPEGAKCLGGGCFATCCESAKPQTPAPRGSGQTASSSPRVQTAATDTPMTCSDAPCEDGMEKNPLHAHKTCTDEADCAETCCLVKCSTFPCKDHGSCNKENDWLRLAPPSKAAETCCSNVDDTCCSGPNAHCVACRQCMSASAYCLSQLQTVLPKQVIQYQRRLRASGNATLQLPLPGTLDDNDLSGGLAPLEYRQLSAAEWAHEEREARAFLENGGPPGNGLYEGEAGRRLKLEFSGQTSVERERLLEGMFENAKKSAAWMMSHQPPRKTSVVDPATAAREEWKKMFQKVVLEAKASGEGSSLNVAGCEPAPEQTMCDYTLTSMFLLHRQFKPEAKRVNSIAVLTDTVNAVSCGTDGLCWVWKIRTGYPLQVFPEHKGPVNTVSVLTDSVYILSGGADSFDDTESGGTAYIWDWRGGFEHKNFNCPDGQWLSSAALPAWRLVGLGCSSNFSYIWDWGGGSAVKLPYKARTEEEVQAVIQSRLDNYKNKALEGKDRLWIREKNATIPPKWTAWSEMAQKKFDQMAKKFHSNNSFGSVNSMSYLPSHLRFVTGHEDGKVRYWNSDSGLLIRAMLGHQGPVNAVAALPTHYEAWSGGDDGTIRLWNLKTGTMEQIITQTYGGPVLSLAVMPGGNKIAVGSHDGYVRLYRRGDLKPLCALNCGKAPVRALAVNPSGPAGQLLVGGDDGYVRVYTPNS